jgi:hypothetical protein
MDYIGVRKRWRIIADLNLKEFGAVKRAAIPLSLSHFFTTWQGGVGNNL